MDDFGVKSISYMLFIFTCGFLSPLAIIGYSSREIEVKLNEVFKNYKNKKSYMVIVF